MGGGYFMSARLIDVETATLTATARPQKFTNIDEIEKTCEAVTASIFESGFSNNSSSSSNTQRHPAEPEMIFVQGGTFRMGCMQDQDTCDTGETPRHQVTVSDFYIGRYEVTQAQWKLLMGTDIRQQVAENYLYGEGDNYPMYCVSWQEVQEFVSRLSTATGKSYRLPTEAEWEYAARGGRKSKGYKFSGSNFVENVAWFMDNSGNSIHPVGTKQPNELGIYDMSGNVWEWCYDWYGAYPAAAQSNPIGPSSGTCRVIRGGGWNYGVSRCRVAYRRDIKPDNCGNILGFRLVCSSK
jgi:formylglycine-generating enzyme required for sulfatase activity